MLILDGARLFWFEPWTLNIRSAVSPTSQPNRIANRKHRLDTMGKKGKKAQAGKPKKLTPKVISKKLDAMAKKLEEELSGADLFAPLPPTEDCPICLLPLSRIHDMSNYMSCCGKILCQGCGSEASLRFKRRNAGKEDKETQCGMPCPFCRTPELSGEMCMRQDEARAAQNDVNACFSLAQTYAEGCEVPVDHMMAIDYWIKAIKLGSATSCSNIATYYHNGDLLPIDHQRKALLDRVGALRGCITARHNIAGAENISGNYELAARHWKIAAEGGSQISFNQLKKVYNGKMKGKSSSAKTILTRPFGSVTRHKKRLKVRVEKKTSRRHSWDRIGESNEMLGIDREGMPWGPG